MKIINFSMLMIIFFSSLEARVIRTSDKSKKDQQLVNKKVIKKEKISDYHGPAWDEFSAYGNNQRNYAGDPILLTDHFRSHRLANSFNGYGMYVGGTNPITYVPGMGVFAAYRMYVAEDPSVSGFIGVALSEDGEDWYSKTDALNPDFGTGRYPSAVMSPSGRATAVWNEYTGNIECYGDAAPDDPDFDTGSRAVYLWDQSQTSPYYFEAEYAAIPGFLDPKDLMPVLGLNEGCYAPGYPQDLWVSHAFMVDHPDRPVILSMFQEGLGNGKHFLFRNDPSQTSYFFGEFNTTYSLMYDPDFRDPVTGDSLFSDGTTGGPDFHINSDGVGYMVQRAYNNLSDTEDPTMATLWFRKTENYGETWTGDDGDQGPTGAYGDKYFYISDSIMVNLSDSLYRAWESAGDTTKLWLTDSIYYGNDERPFVPTPGFLLWYDYDIRTDMDGGMHVSIAAWNYVCPDSAYTDSLGNYIENGCLDLDQDGVADSMYSEYRYGSTGMFHFYFPDPINDPNNAHASLVQEMSDSYAAEWINDMVLLTGTSGPEQYFYPSITLSSEEASEVVWYVGFAGSRFSNTDSSTSVPTDVDLFLSRSEDNGRTWSPVENITNSPGTVIRAEYEITPHLSDRATDNDVYVLYQMPNMREPSLADETPEGFEDHRMTVQVGYYSTDMLSVEGTKKLQPLQFSLDQNYPNPFNPTTTIKFNLFAGADVKLELFDIRGSKVKLLLNEKRPAGINEYHLDASSLSSGVYFYSLTVDGKSLRQKMVHMK